MNLFDPLSWRIARSVDRPTTRETRVRPILATIAVILGTLVPYAFVISIFIAAELWLFFAARHLSAMVARQFLANKKLVAMQRVRDDRRLLWRSAIWLVLSIIWLLGPIQGYVLFGLFRTDLDSLAARVPQNPVTYLDFGGAKIGPFTPNAIARYPHWLEIGLGGPGHMNYSPYKPDAYSIVFVLEDDPGYDYDNTWLWHVRGRWYVQYRP